MTRKFLAQFVLKNENLYIYYLHYSKVHFKKLFQRMMKRWCRIDAPDHWPFDEWDFSPDHSLSKKWFHSTHRPLSKVSLFYLAPLINAHFSDVIGPFCEKTNTLSSLLACKKVGDLRFHLKVESEMVSCLPQSMVWNALLPIKCQFVSNCHVRSKT